MINTPILEFYKNPPFKDPTFECYFILPIKMKNFRFIINLYDFENDKLTIIFRCFGEIKDDTFVGSNMRYKVDQNIGSDIYNKLINTTELFGEVKVYDEKYNVISRLKLNAENKNDTNYIIRPFRSLEMEKTDLDKGIFHKENHNNYIIKRLN
ncbi:MULTISPECIES: hypothetical protein [unclassified Bacillus (in: firmicutes)]|uniref:hypothetical protein n=1 Tax=unclassified Bacillus (in: firmicutes) TaxID=185979 RepID=UPI001BE505FE|nr:MULTISPECIES: hypothetical protein [unclassified Bacillus (in: firmicutes)]MBT2616138.1 hypothetical protein [Bacillus sp. ISL-78]MBT2628412.1 hypothetical protein [Bacillus sp. ISL-101]